MRGRREFTYGLGFGLALLVAGPISALQQIPLPPNSATGRTVTPAYEGWYQNEDGTYSLSFGYFNRNSDEVIEIPLGPDNLLEPASLLQNQPTRFEEGRHWGTFAVRVPADFGDREVTWTLNMKGESLMVPGHMRPDWRIDALREGAHDNTPPVLRFEKDGPEEARPGTSESCHGNFTLLSTMTQSNSQAQMNFLPHSPHTTGENPMLAACISGAPSSQCFDLALTMDATCSLLRLLCSTTSTSLRSCGSITTCTGSPQGHTTTPMTLRIPPLACSGLTIESASTFSLSVLHGPYCLAMATMMLATNFCSPMMPLHALAGGLLLRLAAG